MEAETMSPGRRATFVDPDLQARFERDGYVIAPLLTGAECEALRDEMTALVPVDSAPFYGPYRAADTPSIRRKIDGAVRPRLAAALDSMLDRQSFWMGALMAKHPGPKGYLSLHHDDARVDEERYSGAIAWVALDDTDADTGGLFVVKGSHRVDAPRRGSPRGVREISAIEDELADRYLTHLNVPAGHVVIYDNRLVHGSNPTSGDRLRIAMAAGFKPAEADLVYFIDAPDGETLRYVVTDDYFLDLENPINWGAVDSTWRPPLGPDVLAVTSVGPVRHPLWSSVDLEMLVPTGPPSPPVSLEPEPAPAPVGASHRPRWRRRLTQLVHR